MAKTEVIRKKSMTKVELEQTLLDNFVNLQKVLTNLSVRFDELSRNIEKLLQLFEISAKSFAEKYTGTSDKTEKDLRETDKEFIRKLDNLLDQNKAISKGIVMMEERVRSRSNVPLREEHEPRFPAKPKPLPKY